MTVVTSPGLGTIRQFSHAEPRGDPQSDVAALLRAVADRIERLEPIQVHDVVYRLERDDDGDDRPSMTVYFRPTVDDLVELFAPFVRDAGVSAGVQFVVSHSGSDESSIYITVTDQNGTSDGFSFDRQGTPEDHLGQVLDALEVVQESVHEFIWVTTGRFGPWPRCPASGHAHRLVLGLPDSARQPWWTCPDGAAMTPVGALAAAPDSAPTNGEPSSGRPA